ISRTAAATSGFESTEATAPPIRAPTRTCHQVSRCSTRAPRDAPKAAPALAPTRRKIFSRRKGFRSRRVRLNSARFSGGNSLVVITVQRTARKNTTAPSLKEYCTVKGTPFAAAPLTPRYLKKEG